MLYFLMGNPYVGIQGGIAHIKRTLDLEDNSKKFDTENPKIHSIIGGHIGYTYSFGKPFIGIEGYANYIFGKEYFQPQISLGAKSIVGINICSNFQVHAGIGVDFTRFRSLKIRMRPNPDAEKKEFPLKKYDGEKLIKLTKFENLDYNLSPALLTNIGVKYFITPNITIGADLNILFRKTKPLPKTFIYGTYSTFNRTEDKSFEKYRSIQALFNISYYFGGNA